MRALVVNEWGTPPALREVPVVPPRHGEVQLKVRACGVGRTLLNIIDGELTDFAAEHLPRIPGHEVSGEVVAVGSGVESVRVGDRVITYFYLTCGSCRMCLSGREPLCLNFRGFLGAHRDGGYAQFMTLPARNCFRLPPGINWAEATAICDAILTPLHIARTRTRMAPGDRVVVIGAGGGVGIHMVQMAHLFGAEVWGVESSELKTQAVLECGARGVVDLQETPARVMNDLISGATIVVDTVGRPSTFNWAGKILALGGTLVMITTFPEVVTALSAREMVLKEQTVVGSRYGSHYEMEMAIEMVARGQIRPIVSEVVPLERATELHAKLRDGTLIGRGAVIPGETV